MRKFSRVVSVLSITSDKCNHPTLWNAVTFKRHTKHRSVYRLQC